MTWSIPPPELAILKTIRSISVVLSSFTWIFYLMRQLVLQFGKESIYWRLKSGIPRNGEILYPKPFRKVPLAGTTRCCRDIIIKWHKSDCTQIITTEICHSLSYAYGSAWGCTMLFALITNDLYSLLMCALQSITKQKKTNTKRYPKNGKQGRWLVVVEDLRPSDLSVQGQLLSILRKYILLYVYLKRIQGESGIYQIICSFLGLLPQWTIN